MRKRLVHVVLGLALVLTLGLVGCGGKPEGENPGVELIVSAAASMTDALKEVQPAFEAENQGVKLRFNFGSSGSLQQQIEQGAPADLFISAAPGPMDALVKKGLVEPSAVTPVATNKVVLIRGTAAGDSVRSWDDLKSDQVKRIAMGNPQHVPAGQYSKAVLEKLNLWAAVEKRLVLGEDVRQVLNFVESGEVQAGVVYSSDAGTSGKVVVVAEAPAGSHSPATYPMAVLKESRHASQARAFAQYLLSDKGSKVLAKYGFGPGK